MPRESEVLKKKDEKVEIETGQQTETNLQSNSFQTVTAQQTGQTAQVAPALITEQIHAADFGAATVERPAEPAIEFTARGGVTKSDDSARMIEIRRSVRAYFEKLEEYDRAGEKSKERGEMAEKLLRDAEAIVSSCWWYCFFRHPFSARGIQRKNEVKALRAKVEERIADLRDEVSALKLINKKSYDQAETGKITVSPKGILKIGSKRIHYEKSDIKRIKKKNELKFMQMKDSIRFRRSRKEIRKILSNISEYADIRATVMHVRSAVTAKNTKKTKARIAKLKRENALFKLVRGDIKKVLEQPGLTQEEQDMLTKYKKLFDDTSQGKLKEEDEKNAVVLDYRDRIREGKQSFVNTHQAASGKVNYEANKLDLPLFAHEPCTQDVVQGNMADCYFVSLLSNLVAKDPDVIKNMMHDDGESVTVRFYEKDSSNPGSMKPVLVKVPKILPVFGAHFTLWVRVFEAAYSIFNRHLYDTNQLRKSKGGYNLEKPVDYAFIDGGGDPGPPMSALVGKVSNVTMIKKPKELEPGKKELTAGTLVRDVFRRSSFGAEIKKEQDELEDLAYEKEKYMDTYTMAGYRKIDADPEEADKYEKVLKKEAEMYRKGFAEDVFVFEDEYENNVVCFKEITEQLDAIGDEWTKAHPDVIEKKSRMMKIYNVEIPKLEHDLSELKEDDPEYKRIKDELAGLEEERKEIVKYLKEQDPHNYSDLTKDGIPGEAIGLLEQRKKRRAEALQSDSDSLLEWVCHYKKISAKGGNPQEYIKNTEPVIAALRELSYEQVKDEITYMHMADTMYDMDNEEFSLRQAFEIIKSHAIKTLQLSIEKVNEADNNKEPEFFTGYYTQSMKEYYDQIKESLKKGGIVVAGSYEKKKSSDIVGNAGEKTEAGIAGNHAYSILDCGKFDYNGRKVLMLKLRNPWAFYVPQYRLNEKGEVIPEMDIDKTNGEFWIELTHFVSEFQYFLNI